MQQQLDYWIRAFVRWFGYVPNRDLSGWILLVIAIIAGIGTTILLTQIIRLILRRHRDTVLVLLRNYLRTAFYFWAPSLFFCWGPISSLNGFCSATP